MRHGVGGGHHQHGQRRLVRLTRLVRVHRLGVPLDCSLEILQEFLAGPIASPCPGRLLFCLV